MARARNIKPGFFLNEELGTADPFLQLLFAGLWCLADKEGRLEDRPLRIKAEIFPYREGLDVNGYITQLARMKFIVRYEVEGQKFIEIANFKKHQNPHHTEKPSVIPAPCIITVIPPLNTGENPADSLIPDSGFSDSSIPDSLIPDSSIPEKDILSGQKEKPDPIPYHEIVNHLNAVCNTDYQAKTKATQRIIQARWNEGFRLDHFKKVIDTMQAKWGRDPKMQSYLRPVTLFGTKFESYLNQQVRLSDTGVISPMLDRSLSVFDEWERDQVEKEKRNA